MYYSIIFNMSGTDENYLIKCYDDINTTIHNAFKYYDTHYHTLIHPAGERDTGFMKNIIKLLK